MTCNYLFSCSGYFNYEEGHAPQFPGSERFEGQIVHPQKWTEDIDYAGKRVVVIGSGATAVTLVPAMAETAAHVTMLQRSPTYIVSLPGEDVIANFLRRTLPAKLAYKIVRWKNVLFQTATYQLSKRAPGLVKRIIRRQLASKLPEGYDIDTHFKPRYNPWDERMCLVPDADLFEAVGAGKASVVTDRIETFTETGVKLVSGEELPADMIVTATGISMLRLGGIELAVDGTEIDVSETLAYKGMMLSGVPNYAFAFGYTNASWTLKCDLTCKYVCRLINYMDANGYRQCTPQADESLGDGEAFITDLKSGYVSRGVAQFPNQGAKAPWRLYQNYALDIMTLKYGTIEDGAMQFSSPGSPVEAKQPVAA